MPKYLCIRRMGTTPPQQGEKPSPAQMEEMYAKFNAWKEKFEANIADMGGRLTQAGKIATAEGTKDGPFVEAKEVVGGFMILSAGSIEEATGIACLCPGILMGGGSLEVREISAP